MRYSLPGLAGSDGLGALEIIVVAAVLALLVLVALPGLSGYQSTSAMQTSARQLVSDLRAAQQKAEALNAPVTVAFTAAAGAVTGYSVQTNAAVLWTVTLPSSIHATSSWPGLVVTFQGNGSAAGSGTATALCIDNRHGLAATIAVTAGTGHAALATGSGSC